MGERIYNIEELSRQGKSLESLNILSTKMLSGLVASYARFLSNEVKQKRITVANPAVIERLRLFEEKDLISKPFYTADGILKGIGISANFDEYYCHRLDIRVLPTGVVTLSRDEGATYRKASGPKLVQSLGNNDHTPIVPEINILHQIFDKLGGRYAELAPLHVDLNKCGEMDLPHVYYLLRSVRNEELLQNACELMLDKGVILDPSSVFISKQGDGYAHVDHKELGIFDIWVQSDGKSKIIHQENHKLPTKQEEERKVYSDVLRDIKNYDSAPISGWRRKEPEQVEKYSLADIPENIEKRLVDSTKRQLQTLIRSGFGVHIRRSDIGYEKDKEGNLHLYLKNPQRNVGLKLKVTKFGRWVIGKEGEPNDILIHLNNLLREGNPEGFNDSKFNQSEFSRRHLRFINQQIISMIAENLAERGIDADTKTLRTLASNFDISIDGKVVELRYKNFKGESLKRVVKDDKDFKDVVLELYKNKGEGFVDREGETVYKLKNKVSEVLKQAKKFKKSSIFLGGVVAVTLLSQFLSTFDSKSFVALGSYLELGKLSAEASSDALKEIALQKAILESSKQNTYVHPSEQSVESEVVTTTQSISSDYDLWSTARGYWLPRIETNNWQTEDTDLGWYLSDQTFQFLRANGIQDLYAVDYTHLEDYLTQEQMNSLRAAAETQNSNELNNLIAATPNL